MVNKQRINEEIEKVIGRDSNGQFQPVDLSLAGVNKWRISMGLPPLTKTPIGGRTE